MTEYITIALGGSVISNNFEELERFTEELKKLDKKLVIVTGAGKLKKYIKKAERQGNQAELDLIGIQATRLNAKTIATLLDGYPKTPKKLEEVKKASLTGKDIVMGGLTPGHSTDAVAALVAEILETDLYILSNTDGIYDKDPSKNKDAEKMNEINVKDLEKIISGNNKAGEYEVIDYTALEIIHRSGIKTKIAEGTIRNLKNLDGSHGTDIITEK